MAVASQERPPHLWAQRARAAWTPGRPGQLAPASAPFVAALVVAAPLVWVGVDFVRRRRTLDIPDMFQTVLATIAAADGDQFVGAWSRIGINHPGPAWFYWSAPFSAAFGHHPAAMVLAAGVLAAVCAALVVVTIGRSGGPAAAVVAATVVLGALVQLDLEGVVAPWNPTIVIFPAAAGLVCMAVTWSRGSVPTAVAGVLCGAIVAQSHFGTLGLGTAITIGTLVGVVAMSRRRDRRLGAATVAVLVAVTALPWVPVLIDQTRGDGNAASLVAYAATGQVDGEPASHREGSSRQLGVAESLHHLASVTFLVESDIALWAGVDVDAGAAHRPSWRSLAAASIALVAAVAASRPTRRWPRGPDRLPAWLCRAGLVGLALQVVATLQVRGEYRPYLVAGSAGVGVALWLGVALAALAWARASLPARAAGRVPAVAAAGMVAALALAYPHLDWRVEGDPLPPRAAPVLDSLVEETGGAPILVRADAARLLDTYYSFTWELEQRGVPVAVRGDWSYRFSDRQRQLPFVGREVLLRSPSAAPRSDCTPLGRYRSVVLCLREPA